MHWKPRAALLLASVVLSFPESVGAAEDWIILAETDRYRWEGRAGSLEFNENKAGEQISTATGRMTNRKTNQITFKRWYVRTSDCRKGSGKFVTLDLEGNFQFDTDFILKGGSVASSIADLLCGVVKDADDKGIAI
jgi:hypothetical protein